MHNSSTILLQFNALAARSLQRLQRTYPKLNVPHVRDLCINAYTQPHRHYHTLQHLAECLSLFEIVQHDLEHPSAVELALWFHDVVYDTQPQSATNLKQNDASDKNSHLSNEAQSAAVFKRFCGAALPALTVTQIEQWILATEQHAPTTDPDLQFLLDIDLAILGCSPQRFAEYEQQIRAEYAWVAATVYRKKRLQVLAKFAGQHGLYQSTYFQKRFSGQAKVNLAKALR